MHTRQQQQHALQKQVQRLNGRLAQYQARSQALIRARLILFVLAALVSGVTFIRWGAVPWAVVSVFAFAPFVALVAWHRQVDTAVTRLQFWLAIKQTHLARMDLDWEALPPPLPRPERLEHPFALDLDLLGPRSLHQLLDTAVSQEGSERLRDWLLATQPERDQIHARQERVAALIPQTRFRDKLSLRARLVQQNQRLEAQALRRWLAAGAEPAAFRLPLRLLAGLAGLNILLLLLSLGGPLPEAAWLPTWLLYAALYMTWGSRGTGTLFQDALQLQDGLEVLQAVFGFLEQARYGRMPAIRQLCRPFLDPADRPSQHMRRVKRVVAGVGLQQNPLLGFLLNAALPWNLFFAHHMARCRQTLADRLPLWLDAWAELEALNSLATFAWLNPGSTTFPTIKPGPGTNLQAEQIGHPLVPAWQRVCNDFHLEGAGAVTIITGSNMAGKSTFLRTLGVNLALANAGGPVLAARLETSLFRLYASIRVADSLTDGFSFFYAEVRRLEQLLTELHRREARPLFFLIDEIFRGTNNRERLIGSRAYIRALVDGNGAGLIATHDLELVHLAEESGRIRNFHFRDDVVDGRMVFDYKLHPGPCPTTNALKIMQLAGLPVAEKREA